MKINVDNTNVIAIVIRQLPASREILVAITQFSVALATTSAQLPILFLD